MLLSVSLLAVNFHCPLFTVCILTFVIVVNVFVRLKNCLSDMALVTNGVPQGSILGPSFFSLVMADLNRVNSSTCIIKYADDVSLSIPIFYSTNCVAEEIDNVKNWSLFCWTKSEYQ